MKKHILKSVTIFILLFSIVFGANSQPDVKMKISVFTIGDSTMSNKKADVSPETGWCMVLHNFFNDDVIIKNRAMNGRSSKSFISEGRWKSVADSLNTGDYVFIQFGHNDQKIQDSTRYTDPLSSYRKNLEFFVKQTRLKGANPILFTSIARRKFENGLLIDTHGYYSDAVRKVAGDLKVPLVDLQLLTAGAITAIGEEPSKNIFLWTKATEKFPEGRQDNTHLSKEGAMLVTKLAVQQLLLINNSLQSNIIKQ